MRIAVIGAGAVGATLAHRWIQAGHGICFGSRSPTSDKVQAALSALPGSARAAPVAEAVDWCEVALLATQYRDAVSAVAAAGDFGGRILLDATNPLKPDLSGLLDIGALSAAEIIARAASGARVVKAFNSTGFNVMADPGFSAGRAVMLVCGDDRDARETARRLASNIGFDAIDAGPLSEARLLEAIAMLWIRLAYAHGQGRDIAFSLLRR